MLFVVIVNPSVHKAQHKTHIVKSVHVPLVMYEINMLVSSKEVEINKINF